MTGGRGDAGDKTSVLDILENQWTDAPPMNIARYNHAAIVQGDFLYVFGGSSDGNNLTGSVERLKLSSAAAWKVIIREDYALRRMQPAVCAINDKQIAIFGGRLQGTSAWCSAPCIFDVKPGTVKVQPSSYTNLQFLTQSKTHQIGKSKFMTLGLGKEFHVHMVEFNWTDKKNHSIKSIHNFGTSM